MRRRRHASTATADCRHAPGRVFAARRLLDALHAHAAAAPARQAVAGDGAAVPVAGRAGGARPARPRRNVPPEALEFMLVMMFMPQALLPLVALLYASGIIQDEQEEQTITYLLMRPIPKWAIYTVKLLAAMTTTAVLVVVFTGADVRGDLFRHRRCPSATWSSAGSRRRRSIRWRSSTYCSLFGLMSLRHEADAGGRHPLHGGRRRAAGQFAVQHSTGDGHLLRAADRLSHDDVPCAAADRRERGHRRDGLAARTCRAIRGLIEHPQLGTCIAMLLDREPGLHGDRRLALLAARVPREDAGEGLSAADRLGY